MFGKSEKIFAIYEKPEASEPTDRVVLLRDGFHWGVFIFNALWFIWQRRWATLLFYMIAATALVMIADALHVSHTVSVLMQIFLNLLLAYEVNDIQGWLLRRRGYRFAGILTAESEMKAERRYYEYAA